MAVKKIVSRTITLRSESGAFSTLFGMFKTDKKAQNPDLSLLRSILSNEKAKMIHVLKTKQPNSIYELAKILGRDFKSVRQDLAVLEKFGLIEIIPIHKGNREKLKPILVVDQLKINFDFG